MARTQDLMTVKQAARFLGVADNTMRNWDTAGGTAGGAVPARTAQTDRQEGFGAGGCPQRRAPGRGSGVRVR